jgi:hypothetical protein
MPTSHHPQHPDQPTTNPSDPRTWNDDDLEAMRLDGPRSLPEPELKRRVKDALEARGQRSDDNTVENAIADEDFHRDHGWFQ